jgi:hypothetical protein
VQETGTSGSAETKEEQALRRSHLQLQLPTGLATPRLWGACGAADGDGSPRRPYTHGPVADGCFRAEPAALGVFVAMQRRCPPRRPSWGETSETRRRRKVGEVAAAGTGSGLPLSPCPELPPPRRQPPTPPTDAATAAPLPLLLRLLRAGPRTSSCVRVHACMQAAGSRQWRTELESGDPAHETDRKILKSAQQGYQNPLRP